MLVKSDSCGIEPIQMESALHVRPCFFLSIKKWISQQKCSFICASQKRAEVSFKLGRLTTTTAPSNKRERFVYEKPDITAKTWNLHEAVSLLKPWAFLFFSRPGLVGNQHLSPWLFQKQSVTPLESLWHLLPDAPKDVKTIADHIDRRSWPECVLVIRTKTWSVA